jgi:periplasmic protein TonB
MKYITIVFFAIFCLAKLATAQYPPPPSHTDSSTDEIITKVDVVASFPGGDGEWRNYLMKNLNINKVAEKITIPRGKKELRQTIIVKFIVDKEGNISDVSVANPGAEPNCIAEAIRVIKISPEWVPAKQNGRIVKAYRFQPVTFVFER